jgi:superfamily II DNA/RNA helicase
MGFIPDIERIVKLLPFTRQTLFFSATMPPEISRLVDRFLSNPVRVEVSKPASIVDTIAHKLVASGGKPEEKRATLRSLINEAGPDLKNAIIFCNRKRDVATVHRSLLRHGYSVGALHGDMDQHARLATLDSFRDNRITLLVASDVAARGLDIPAVSHIFNYDIPTHSEDYVHRVGRTGRAGRSGQALTIVTKAETKYVQSIEKLIGKTIEWHAAPSSDSADETREPARPRASDKAPRSRGRGDRRRSAGKSRSAAPSRERETESRQTAAPARSRAPAEKQRQPESKRAAVGFDDHVPAFLLRPVRAPAEAVEEV